MLIISCSKDDIIPAPTADFTSEADADDPLTITFTNTSLLATSYEWDFGDGSAVSTDENPTHTYAEGGDYTVTLTAKSEGGTSTKTLDLTLIAAEIDLIEGGDMSDPEAWTIEGAGATATTTEFADGKLLFSNGVNSQTNIKVYQTVEVEAGKTYIFSANIKGAGATNSWVEILFGKEAPVADTDYNNGMYTGLNTWDGCGTSAFDTNLATLGCKNGAAGTGKNGEVTFAESGTIYVVIKAGSWEGTLGTGGVELDDVKLIEQ